ncbi:hypothetical protein HK104_009728 [Borealophlyctis nickersoniae]|nr:hypothetical protein HK104_009728 [Borealophlyctis nickersoniae]
MEICGMTGNEGSPHVWKHSTFADSILRSDTFDSPSFLSTICQLPPADFDLLVRVAQCGLFDRFDASSGKTTKLNDSISALALFFECDGRRPYIYFNVLVKRTMNALVEGSRLLVLVIHFDLFYAIDEDRRVIKGTAWWRIERPQQRPFISTGDMTSLFGDTRTVFKVKGRTGEFGSSWHNTKLKVHLGGTHTVGAVVNKAKMRVDKDFKGTLGLKDGQSYSWYHADLHDITWEETGILSGIM